MPLDDIRNILRNENALVVHFSGTPRGIGGGQIRPDFPADLQQVAKNAHVWEVACSTVSTGQTRGTGSIIGSVGLILQCQDGGSLLGVFHDDAGSWYDPSTGRRNLGCCVVPTTASCTSSIKNRVHYNEWVLRDYVTVGVFIDGSFDVWDSSVSFQRETDLDEIQAAFPELPVIRFCGTEIWEVRPQLRLRSIDDFI